MTPAQSVSLPGPAKKEVESVLEALPDVARARVALAKRLAADIDADGTAPYVRAQLARTLAGLLAEMAPAEGVEQVARRVLADLRS